MDKSMQMYTSEGKMKESPKMVKGKMGRWEKALPVYASCSLCVWAWSEWKWNMDGGFRRAYLFFSSNYSFPSWFRPLFLSSIVYSHYTAEILDFQGAFWTFYRFNVLERIFISAIRALVCRLDILNLKTIEMMENEGWLEAGHVSRLSWSIK